MIIFGVKSTAGRGLDPSNFYCDKWMPAHRESLGCDGRAAGAAGGEQLVRQLEGRLDDRVGAAARRAAGLGRERL